MVLRIFFCVSVILILTRNSECQKSNILEIQDALNLRAVCAMIPDNELMDYETDCKRPCKGSKRRVCYRKFNVEHYAAMGPACGNCSLGILQDCFSPQCVTATGIERGIITVNRQMPGPLLELCQNDIVVIDVINHLHAESTSIHWHGLLQRNTQIMDGVPFITQCPINPASTFRYTYIAADYGTYFYHAHSGIQRFNGLYGGLIIRPQVESNSHLYDVDNHVMLIKEWNNDPPETFVIGLPTREPGLLPQTILVNGKGKYPTAGPQKFTPTPYETFFVTSGKRYRFRIVNAGSTVCPIEIQVQNHNLTIVAADASNIDPITVSTLTMFSGERYDIVIHANQPVNQYWIHIKGVGFCRGTSVYQNAILSYKITNVASTEIPSGIRAYNVSYSNGPIYNSASAPCNSTSNTCVTELTSAAAPDLWNKPVDQKFYFTIGIDSLNTKSFFNNRTYTPFLNIFDSFIFLGTVNGVSYVPPSSPLMTQPNDLDKTKFCSYMGSLPEHCKNMEICTCTHVVNVKRNALVEIVFIDTSSTASVSHPMHVHGFKFSVVAEGQFLDYNGSLTVDAVKKLEANGLLKNKNQNAILKDVILVKTKGVAVIRFIADNPGQWLVHCHVEDHMIFGMMFVLNVAGETPPVPPNFPKCGNFQTCQLPFSKNGLFY